jgi:hypothetical protein
MQTFVATTNRAGGQPDNSSAFDYGNAMPPLACRCWVVARDARLLTILDRRTDTNTECSGSNLLFFLLDAGCSSLTSGDVFFDAKWYGMLGWLTCRLIGNRFFIVLLSISWMVKQLHAFCPSGHS